MRDQSSQCDIGIDDLVKNGVGTDDKFAREDVTWATGMEVRYQMLQHQLEVNLDPSLPFWPSYRVFGLVRGMLCF